jgi:hypothetical protein
MAAPRSENRRPRSRSSFSAKCFAGSAIFPSSALEA